MALTDAQSRDIAIKLNEIESSGASAEEQVVAIEKLKESYPKTWFGETQKWGETFDEAVSKYGAANGINPVLKDYLGETGEMGAPTTMFEQKDVLKNLPDDEREEFLKTYLVESEQATKDGQELVAAIDQTEGASSSEFITLQTQTHQCILTHYIDTIADFHRKQMNKNGKLVSRFSPDTAIRGAEGKIFLVDDSSSDSATRPINSFTSFKDADQISKVGTHEIAGLMPLLRLYKIYREKGVEKSKVEFKFSNKTDSGFLKGTPEQKFGEFVMDAGYAKGRSAGIKSFDWSFVGGDPFTATRDLTATLKIFFQDFRDLTEVRTDSKNLFKPDAKNPDYKYLDLVVQPDCREAKKEADSITVADDGSTREAPFRPECYEIAVEVGYVSSPTSPSSVSNQTDTLYLTMVEHAFDIGQDGTFELTIKYRARIAQLLGDKGMNVLMPGGGKMITTPGGLMWRLDDLEEKISEEKERLEEDDKTTSTSLSKLQKMKSWMLNRRNNSFYSGVMTTLFEDHLVYSMAIKEATFFRFSNYSIYGRKEADKEGEGANELLLDGGGSEVVKESDIGVAGGANIDAHEHDATILENEAPPGGTEGQTSLTARNNKKNKIYFTTLGNLLSVVLYHVLGKDSIVPMNTSGHYMQEIEDLIEDIAANEEAVKEGEAKPDEEKQKQLDEQLGQVGGTDRIWFGKEDTLFKTFATGTGISMPMAQTLKRFRMILGTISYDDIADGKRKTLNLAHLPISIDMFRQFMIDKVISRQRTFYSFQDFMEDLTVDIVLDSLNRVCFAGYSSREDKHSTVLSLVTAQHAPKKNELEVMSQPIVENESIYKVPAGYDRFKASRGEVNFPPYKMIHLSNVTKNNPLFSQAKSDSSKQYDYMIFSVISTNVINSNLHGDEGDDADKGILHFRYGSTKGFLKSISFTKTPLEYAAEERYVREGSDNLLNQLAGRYEMQMSMVGNNLFIPGTYIYFDPVALGVGKTNANDKGNRSLANLMGLGGYHIITEVGSSISPGKFETTIKALWETGGVMPPKTE